VASVHPNASKRFPDAHKVRYRHPGGRAGGTTFETREQADRFVRMIDDYGLDEALARIGLSEQPQRATGMTVAQCLERFIAQRTSSKTRAKYRLSARKHINPTLGSVRINQLTTEDIQLWVNKLAPKFSGATLTWVYMPLNAALNEAVHRGEIRTNPARKTGPTNPNGVKLPRLARKRATIFLTGDEYRLLLRAIPEPYKLFVEFLYESGCRIGEACALTPTKVNLDSGRVIFDCSYSQDDKGGYAIGLTKSRESSREVAIPARILERLDLTGEHVFMTPNRAVISPHNFRETHWNRARRDSGLPRHRWPRPHDLRHTHASRLIDAGISLPAIQRRLGHADVMTTLSMYGHPAENSENKILAALENS
jgi:integrase